MAKTLMRVPTTAYRRTEAQLFRKSRSYRVYAESYGKIVASIA